MLKRRMHSLTCCGIEPTKGLKIKAIVNGTFISRITVFRHDMLIANLRK